MNLPGPLASRRGRLATFFVLYVTEGIPLGFAGVAIATQLSREGVDAAAIAAFTAAIYLPWAFKWLAGPVVDVFSSDRYGRRRIWILAMQLGMVASLLLMHQVGLDASMEVLTGLVILHNIFGATQDIAIDALAVSTLRPDERGMAGALPSPGPTSARPWAVPEHCTLASTPALVPLSTSWQRRSWRSRCWWSCP